MTQEYDTPEEAIAASIKNGPVAEFDGMNCNDYIKDDAIECSGWDGESRRCECGNRRVYWATAKQDNGKFYAFAEAY